MSPWIAIRSNDVCPIPQVYPVDQEGWVTGHDDGLSCPCMPCLDDNGVGIQVLVHHEMREGQPVRCFDEGAHICTLAR